MSIFNTGEWVFSQSADTPGLGSISAMRIFWNYTLLSHTEKYKGRIRSLILLMMLRRTPKMATYLLLIKYYIVFLKRKLFSVKHYIYFAWFCNHNTGEAEAGGVWVRCQSILHMSQSCLKNKEQKECLIHFRTNKFYKSTTKVKYQINAGHKAISHVAQIITQVISRLLNIWMRNHCTGPWMAEIKYPPTPRLSAFPHNHSSMARSVQMSQNNWHKMCKAS